LHVPTRCDRRATTVSPRVTASRIR
jgi:hypothetical protein